MITYFEDTGSVIPYCTVLPKLSWQSRRNAKIEFHTESLTANLQLSTYSGWFKKFGFYFLWTFSLCSTVLRLTDWGLMYRSEMGQVIQKPQYTPPHPLAKGVWQALLINNLSYVVESSLSSEKRSSQAELHCDTIFRPLESWEQPKSSLAGSGKALANPLLHLVGYFQSSFSPPWPLKGHPTGIRQTQLPPPPQRPTESQEPPRFHRFSLRRLAGNSTPINSSSNGTTSANAHQSTTEFQSDTSSGSGIVPLEIDDTMEYDRHENIIAWSWGTCSAELGWQKQMFSHLCLSQQFAETESQLVEKKQTERLCTSVEGVLDKNTESEALVI